MHAPGPASTYQAARWLMHSDKVCRFPKPNTLTYNINNLGRPARAENFGLRRLHLANVILTERPGGRVDVEVLLPNERRELDVYESSILQLTEPRNALPNFMRTSDILAEKAKNPALLPPAEVRFPCRRPKP